MKKETGIVLAGSIGFLAVLGIIGVRKFLQRKQRKYDDDYRDYYRHFEKRYKTEDPHGVEFLSVL